jgi:two-component system phosphate regulon sensor histidine kinase PhoR
MIDDIHRHANHLDHLVGEVMALTRLDSEPAVSPPSPLNLNQLLQTEVDRQQPLARQKQQRLSLHLAEPLQIEGHPEQLQQIFSNLLGNAIRYTQPGGEISCRSRSLTTPTAAEKASTWPGLSDLPPGRWAACRISDTGPGIAAEHLPHLFERFYRVKTERAVRGSGLGLSIVKELVNRYHGYVAIASAPGEGTSVGVYLPLK